MTDHPRPTQPAAAPSPARSRPPGSRTIWIVLLLLLALVFSGCAKKEPKPDCPIKVGIVTSLTGSSKEGGQEHMSGYEIALDEINAAGGVLGCELQLVVKDDASLPLNAQMAVKELVTRDEVLAIIGAYTSDATIPAAGVANVYQVPFLVPTASTDLITQQGYEWVFRVNASGSAYASTALAFVQEKLGTTATLAVIYEDTLFGESGAVAIGQDATNRGIRLIAYEAYQRGAIEAETLFRSVKAAKPDVIFFVSNNVADSQKLMQATRLMDINPRVILGYAGGFVVPRFLQGGPEAEYVIATAQWATDVQWPGVDEFNQTFQARFAAEPGMRSAQTYISLLVILDAIQRAGSNPDLDWKDLSAVRQAVRNALKETQLKDTLFGPIKFDWTGQNTHPVVLVQVLNGRFVSVYPGEFKAQDPVIPIPPWSERMAGQP